MARQINTNGLPVEQSVAHRVDLARAYNYDARTDEGLAELLTAEQGAPQIVWHSAVGRGTVKSLHRRGHATGTNRALLGLAERCRTIQ